jgi:hypothetical protein
VQGLDFIAHLLYTYYFIVKSSVLIQNRGVNEIWDFYLKEEYIFKLSLQVRNPLNKYNKILIYKKEYRKKNMWSYERRSNGRIPSDLQVLSGAMSCRV